MELLESLNQRVKKLGFLNVQLVKITNWFFALIVLKFIPEILNVDTIWFVLLLILFALKPFYTGFFKKDKSGKNNRFTKNLSFVDLQLTTMANWFFVVIVVKYYPGILTVNSIWFAALLVLFSLNPIFVVWFKNGKDALGKQNNPSVTAYKVALMRAAHQLIDNPKVFEDPIAIRIVGDQGISEIHSDVRSFKTRLQNYLRASVVARSRFAGDELSAAIKGGVRQYVILGAGLDTFAYGNPYSSAGLRVFEIDHPATQAWKQQHLSGAKINIPENLIFVPMDFESESLADKLGEAGFRTDEPSFFSWLGVTMYLTRETIMKTMEYISSSTPLGSGIVFDYVIPPLSQNFLRQLVFRSMARRLARAGEPWVSFLDPTSLKADLKKIGFTRVDDIGPEEINEKYFKNRADKLMVGYFGHLMKAQH